MDIATKFASGQEAVEAIFRKDKQPQGRQPEDVPEASTQRGTKKKGKKKSQAKRVAAAEYKNPRKPPGGASLFDKMLKEPCPYHQGPVKHTLEEGVMLRRHFHRAGPPAQGGRARDDDKKEDHEAIFRKDKQPQGRQPEDVPEASTQRGTKKKGKKKSQAKRVAAAEYKNPRKPPGGASLFDKMLKEPCPYHQGPVKHTLEEGVMLRRHFHRAGPPAQGGRARDDDKKEDHQAVPRGPRLLHDLWWASGERLGSALQARAPGGLFGEGGGASLPRLV